LTQRQVSQRYGAFKRVHDKNDGNKSGKAVLGEACYEFDQNAQVEHDQQKNEQRSPKTNP